MDCKGSRLDPGGYVVGKIGITRPRCQQINQITQDHFIWLNQTNPKQHILV